MKLCRPCSTLRDELDFYRGHSECKPCTRAAVAAWAKLHPEKGRARDKRRGRERDKKPGRREKVAARHTTHVAIKKGVLRRLPCEVCSTTPAHAHHDDYSKPLDVRWLCKAHHDEHHRNARSRAELSGTQPPPLAL